MKTEIVNIKSNSYHVYIGRKSGKSSGYFGNPFSQFSREENIKLYKIYFDYRIKTDLVFRNRIHQLKGKVLGCFCKPLACHGDIIIAYLEGL